MLRTLAILAGLLATPAIACQVSMRATIALTEAGGLMLVPVAINGAATSFVLDTGAERSVVSLQTADRVHLARDEWVSTDIRGVGGPDRRRLGRPSSLTTGGVALRRRTLAEDDSLVVGPIPASVAGQPIDGLLGQDYLSNYDLDLDPAAGTLTLYDVRACSGRFLPWRGRYVALPAWRPVRNILAVPLRVGDRTLEAELDSGAAVSVITLPGMVALGLQPGGPDTLAGFGPDRVAARQQRFPVVAVANLPAGPATLSVAPVQTMRSIGALLGADWLKNRHVWISWATNQLFVAQPS